MPDGSVGRQRLRSLWRVPVFLAVALAVYVPLQVGIGAAVAERSTQLARLAADNAALAVALLVASYAMMRRVEGRALADLGLPWGRGAVAGLGRGSVIGAVLIASLVALQALVGWLRPQAAAGTPGEWLSKASALALLFAVAAAAEELLFRGYAFRVLVGAFGWVLAVIVSSALFALMHVANPGADRLALLNIGLAGALMAVAYLRSGSLWLAIGLHWAWNWVMAVVLDLPVSGFAFDMPGYDLRETGPDLATGGEFGPEAGLLGTLVLVAGLLWVSRSRRLVAGGRVDGS